MSQHSTEDLPSTPDAKSSLAFSGVFKSFTRSNRTSGVPKDVAPGSSPLDISAPTAPKQKPKVEPLDAKLLRLPDKYQSLLQKVAADQPLPERVSAAVALRDVVREFSLSSVAQIGFAAKDLISPQNGKAARRAGFDLLIACAQEASLAPLDRRQFFEILSQRCHQDDTALQLKALLRLTNGGRDVSSCEGVLLPLVSGLLKDAFMRKGGVRKKLKEKKTKITTPLEEEVFLNEIFTYVKDLIRFNFASFQKQELSVLLDDILQICKLTTAEADISNSVELIDLLVTYGELPNELHSGILNVLCSTLVILGNLKEPTWRVIANLCRSHLASSTVSALLAFIDSSSEDPPPRNTHPIRGAVIAIDRLRSARGTDGLVTVSYPVWLDAMHRALDARNTRLDRDVLSALANILEGASVTDAAPEDEDPAKFFDTLQKCCRCVSGISKNTPIKQNRRVSPSKKGNETPDDKDGGLAPVEELHVILQRLDQTYTDLPNWREGIMQFYYTIRNLLPDSHAELLVRHYRDHQLCHPSHEDWSDNLGCLVESFLANQQRKSSLRTFTLDAICTVWEHSWIHFSSDVVLQSFLPIARLLIDEPDRDIQEKFVLFATDIALKCDDKVFAEVMQCFGETCKSRRASTASSSTTPNTSTVDLSSAPNVPENGISLQRLVCQATSRIFLESMTRETTRAKVAFDLLLEIARSQEMPTDARLMALKLPFRIRSDREYAIFVVSSPDVTTAAAVLGRTVTQIDDRLTRRQTLDQSPVQDGDGTTPNRKKSMQQLSRTSAISRSESRNSTSPRRSRGNAPSWIHPEPKALSIDPPLRPSDGLSSSDKTAPGLGLETPTKAILDIKLWLELLISNIREHSMWEVYSYTVVYLQSQLVNHALFVECVPQIQMLRSVLCDQIKTNNFFDPQGGLNVKKADVAICLFQLLSRLVSYHGLFSKNEQDDLVRMFVLGLSWEGSAKTCIHALSICCYEIPLSISKSIMSILQKMSQIVTQSQVAIHVLEFLAALSRMHEIYANFRDDEYRTIFGISFRYLQSIRDQRKKVADQTSRASHPSSSHGGAQKSSILSEISRPSPSAVDEVPQYVYALAYNVITFWFLSLKMTDRSKHVGWIAKNLISTDAAGNDYVDEQTQVTIDMMQRTTYSDLDETLPDTRFDSLKADQVSRKSWVLGLSIVTVETDTVTGESQVTKRQPTATSYWLHRSTYAPRPSHQVPLSSNLFAHLNEQESVAAMLPGHILLQMMSSCAPTPETMRPQALPDDDAIKRAIGSLDRVSTVDGHKVGVIYIDDGQTSEQEILANTSGGSDYHEFLAGLGTLVRLKGATFNTQGLDREFDNDGEWAYCWRDRVTEMVFHVTTLMPTNLEHDPHCSLKKRHTGNDYVTIVYNNSGLPYDFGKFPSQFNFVNIVITPGDKTPHTSPVSFQGADMEEMFYTVQVMSKPEFPEISPAFEEKVVSGKTLPSLVRTLALTGSVFSLVWANRNHGDELVSSWRNRLRQINKLRERLGAPRPASSVSPPSTNTSSPFGAGSNMGSMMSQMHGSRDSSHTQRDSFNLTFRRSSAANIFSDALSGGLGGAGTRTSTATTASGSDTDTGLPQQDENIIEKYDFSKWV